MELKKWNEYTEDEKKRLLVHWWYNHGKQLVNEKEILDFYKLVNDDTEKMKSFAVSCYTMGISNEYLLRAMNGNFVGILLDSFPDEKEVDESTNKLLQKKEDELLRRLVLTYNLKDDTKKVNTEEDSQ